MGPYLMVTVLTQTSLRITAPRKSHGVHGFREARGDDQDIRHSHSIFMHLGKSCSSEEGLESGRKGNGGIGDLS